MKILTLSNCPLDENQGSGYVIMNYARGLRERGHQVRLLGPESYEPLRALRFAKGHRQAVGMLASVLTALRREHYDVVEFYGGESCLAARVLASWPHRKFLLVSHSNGLETHVSEQMRKHLGHATLDGAPPRFHQRIFRLPMSWAFRAVDALVTVSENDAAFAREARYRPESRILSLENPLPENFLGQATGLERARRIAFCGSWLPIKGRSLLIETLPGVLARFPDATFTLVGVGEGFRAGDHFPPEILPRVEVIPHVADKLALQRLYQTFSIVLLPSVYESFGLAAAEAMACGCALVATRTGFAASLGHMEEALLLDAPDAALLEQAIATLLNDDALRRRLAENGRRRVQQLRWEPAVDRLENAYEKWLGELRFGKIPE